MNFPLLRGLILASSLLLCAFGQGSRGGAGGGPSGPGRQGGMSLPGGGGPGGPAWSGRPDSAPRSDDRGSSPRNLPAPGRPGTDAPAPSSNRKVLQQEISTLRRTLDQLTPFSSDEHALFGLASEYLSRGEQIRDKKRSFVAERLVASAAALSRAFDLARRLPEARNAPSRDQASRRLEDVYLRLQQADYFLEQTSDPLATPLPDLARRWYQRALAALDRDTSTSLHLSDGADQIVSALENLAQARAWDRRQEKK